MEEHVIGEDASFIEDNHFQPASRITGKALLMKLPHEIHVEITDVELEADTICGRCLKSIRVTIEVPFAEREFNIDLDPKDIEEGEDMLDVDMKRRTLNISEMLRAEILLHFMGNAVCCGGCKGLCAHCGGNLNCGDCKCRKEAGGREGKPFSKLKDLI